MMTPLDFAVIAVYFVSTAILGLRLGGKQGSATDYFLGGRNLPWWAVCFSIVATETSTLTVISVPGIAFGGNLLFFSMTFGYLVARFLVATFFLPRYVAGEMETAYQFLGHRFGDGMRATASVTFMVTRLLADGVRLFATAIPIKVILAASGWNVDYVPIIVCIGLVTVVYTLIGGIRAVVWMDVLQMSVYVGGALFSLVILSQQVPPDWWAQAAAQGKTVWLDLGQGKTPGDLLTSPYWIVCAVVGGAVFGMASHGTDHIIVQRLLTCRSLQDSRKAIVASGFIVMAQFALFLIVGLMLWAHYGGKTAQDMGLTRNDEVYPKFIIDGLPPGVTGLILAGILAAAMSTLSSSLNALASATMSDLVQRFSKRAIAGAEALKAGRWITLGWSVVFIGFACAFRNTENPVVELGLAIASFTYGGLLGAFLLGMTNRRINQRGAILTFLLTVAAMTVVVLGVWYGKDGWTFVLKPSAEAIKGGGLKALAWPWYTAIGACLSLALGWLLTLAGFRSGSK